MNRKIVTIILSLGLIGCFFLPYLKDIDTVASGFKIVTSPIGPDAGRGVIVVKYIWLLIPVSSLILLIGALNNGNYFLGRFIWACLPILTILAFLGKIYIDGKRADAIPSISEVANMIGYGLWITLGLSLILVFYWPKRKS